jgi:hypothetical protein
MDSLFSCRNCIHNCSQTLSLGFGDGFCVKHDSVIENPYDTTCKYLHRKDLPYFVVDEGVREHASEYVFFTNMATLSDKKPLSLVRYSERHVWDNRHFSPIIHSLSQYHRMNPSWVFVQNFAGSADGIRAITHASLVRHYLDNCGNWKSSYRLILALLQEIHKTPYIADSELVLNEGYNRDEIKEDAFWEIIFSRLSALQEYGWHAGNEEITWITDKVNGSLTDFDWNSLSTELEHIKVQYTDSIIKLAKDEQVYFPQVNYQL